ncbi:MAG TPA: aryl-sulfate sulfotransferase [Bryobacteraceae bacterium]
MNASWAAAAILYSTALHAQISVTLTPSQPSPVPLGTVITWTAAASGQNTSGQNTSGQNGGTPTFRFRARLAGGDFHTIVDYGPNSFLSWTTIQREGTYEIEVSAMSADGTQTAATSAMMVMTSLVNGGVPVITPTANPLVFIYSAPPCPNGQQLSVQITSPEGYVQSTPTQTCAGFSVNFYLAGMRPQAQYTVQHTVHDGTSVAKGPAMTLPMPAISLPIPSVSILSTTTAPSVDGILLHSPFSGPPFTAYATDLQGNVVWYYPGNISYLTRPQTGGTFLGVYENGALDQSQQFFLEFDLAGNTLAETNAARVNQQLAAMGVHAIDGFHHEARKLPNGNYLVLADSERILTDVQGPGPVDVIGDMILVLGPNLQVLWAWDAFNYLDPSRAAILREICTYPTTLSCAPFYLAQKANDWLHGNCLSLTPDGNILYSMRNQDWVIKIDYGDTGSGNILWTLGAGGDFTISYDDPRVGRSDPYPWFSGQHDVQFEPDSITITVYDDGNTRIATTEPSGHSRGQALRIDEKKREARLILDADLGAYSDAVGSAQLLPNGNYSFDNGFLNVPPGSANFFAQSLEVNPEGQTVYGVQFGFLEYRTFRMPDLYTAPY